ncbi:MAG: homoserine dehydrogenase, partial [Selenomonas sp.]|nr:homoserine dehydrogenase [Selenomonas sp.]
MEKMIRVGLLGSGTVGSGVVQVLEMNREQITERVGAPIQLKTVLVRDLNKKRPNLAGYQLTDNYEDILKDDEIDIVVELMGGLHPAREYMLQAMEHGKSVVTANKDVVAQFGKDMFDMAEKHGVDFMFEASV